MVDVAAALATAELVISAIVKAAPAIIEGTTKAKPYVEALAGMIAGSNASDEQIAKSLGDLQALSAAFQTPLPDDPDGKTQT